MFEVIDAKLRAHRKGISPTDLDLLLRSLKRERTRLLRLYKEFESCATLMEDLYHWQYMQSRVQQNFDKLFCALSSICPKKWNK